MRRNPEYERPARRGGGTARQTASAELTLPDGRVVTKQKDVDAELRTILGIDRQQFGQIAMLAQGEFMKLLLADTRTKQEIFRNIFKTQAYSTLQNRLKEETSRLKAVCESKEAGIAQYVGELDAAPDDAESAAGLALCRDGRQTLTDTAELAKRLCALDRDREDEKAASIRQAEERLQNINALLVRREERTKTENDWKSARINRDALASRLTLQQEKLQEWEKNRPLMEETEKEISAIRATLSDYEEADRLKEELDRLQAGLETRRTAIADRTAEREAVAAEHAAALEERAGLVDIEENLARLDGDKKTAEKLRQDLEQLASELNSLQSLTVRYESAKNDYIHASAACREAGELYGAAHTAYLDEGKDYELSEPGPAGSRIVNYKACNAAC